MSTVTIQGAANPDTYIRSDQATTAKDGGPLNIGESNASAAIFRALIKFDVSNVSNIPAGSTINSATLSLNLIDNSLASNIRTMRVYRLKRAWTEGTATWNTTDGSTSWTTAGAGDTTSDREAADIGSLSIGVAPALGFKDVTLTASKIQEMISGGTFTNNGFIIQMDTENNDAHGWDARESASPSSNSPKLVIDYTAPVTSGGSFLLNFV